LAVALAECAIAGGRGARVAVPAGRRADEALFGEGAGRVVVTCRPGDVDALRAAAGDVPLREIGTVGGDAVEVRVGEDTVAVRIADAAAAYEDAIPRAVEA
ncbi:MAG: AIR synthase-related protein, partial [Actinomycetota bacterium]